MPVSFRLCQYPYFTSQSNETILQHQITEKQNWQTSGA